MRFREPVRGPRDKRFEAQLRSLGERQAAAPTSSRTGSVRSPGPTARTAPARLRRDAQAGGQRRNAERRVIPAPTTAHAANRLRPQAARGPPGAPIFGSSRTAAAGALSRAHQTGEQDQGR
ncbi:hypothetical protein NDU88_006659 [Pleurodeles waltl]|uniref:Uncharacterized protein n=1 Tax=Pleurodeles waltl TaxID=8319 RepID=A0AAV7RN38_PLEWA|nr:hypothetical protein NDU88_006659 [Pleurodeles waltl]